MYVSINDIYHPWAVENCWNMNNTIITDVDCCCRRCWCCYSSWIRCANSLDCSDFRFGVFVFLCEEAHGWISHSAPDEWEPISRSLAGWVLYCVLSCWLSLSIPIYSCFAMYTVYACMRVCVLRMWLWFYYVSELVRLSPWQS